MRKTTQWQRAQASEAMRFDACSVQQILAAHHFPNRGECAAAWLAQWEQDPLILKSAHLRDRLAKQQLYGCKIERLKDLLCCAFEGGTNYWIDRVETPPMHKRPLEMEFWHEAPIYDLALIIHHDRDQVATLNGHALLRGLTVLKQKYPRHWHNFEIENEDAETGDVFVQCCIFGEIIYG